MALNIAKSPLIAPVVGLGAWTLVMEVWMYSTRLPAINKAVEDGKLKVDSNMTKSSMDESLPASARWPADNFNHLHEQPTTFYAVTLALALLEPTLTTSNLLNTTASSSASFLSTHNLARNLAWGYVGVRVAHSLVQGLSNDIQTRFKLFSLSSLALAGLTARAGYLLSA